LNDGGRAVLVGVFGGASTPIGATFPLAQAAGAQGCAEEPGPSAASSWRRQHAGRFAK